MWDVLLLTPGFLTFWNKLFFQALKPAELEPWVFWMKTEILMQFHDCDLGLKDKWQTSGARMNMSELEKFGFKMGHGHLLASEDFNAKK